LKHIILITSNNQIIELSDMYVFKEFDCLRANKMIITLAPTGMIPTKKDTPYVPITPEEIATDVYKAYTLGASVVHVHARDELGKPTYKKEKYEQIFLQIKKKCPDIIICASTSGRVDPQVEHRGEVLDLYPDMASLTMGSLNFPKYPSVNPMDTIITLAKMMNARGIMPELEIFEAGFINTAKYLVRKGYLKEPLHFCLLLGSLGSISANLSDITYLVSSLPSECNWSATGIGRFQTQINVAAILMGGHVRVGVEDSIYYNYPDEKLATNANLVKRIVRIAKDLNREIATPDEARKILGLSR